MPAVLIECGVILNREEERSLLTRERQARITAAITRGVADYLRRTPSPLRAAKTARQPERQASPGSYPILGTPLQPSAAPARQRPE
jgi:hypothetical protein